MKKIKMIVLLSLIIISCNPQSKKTFCDYKIKQPTITDSFRVYSYYGGYVVGHFEKMAVPSEDGYIHIGAGTTKYDTIFVRLVFDPRLQVYYPFPENQTGTYNTITESDSCLAKKHWHKYTLQWK